MLASQPELKPSNSKKGRKFRAGIFAAFSMIGLFGDSSLPDVMQLHHLSPKAVDDGTLTVMTANVHGWQGRSGQNFDKFRETLQSERPDLVCMQEVFADGDELGHLYDDGYNVLFATTKRYPFRGRFGNAVLSKSALKLIEVVKLPNPRTLTPRSGILFSIDTNKNDLDFINLHLSINGSESDQQAVSAFDEVGHRVEAVCGDMNQAPSTVESGPFGRMVTHQTTANRALTYPASDPVRKIDYILPGCSEPINGSNRVAMIDSDHLAVISKLDISNC